MSTAFRVGCAVKIVAKSDSSTIPGDFGLSDPAVQGVVGGGGGEGGGAGVLLLEPFAAPVFAVDFFETAFFEFPLLDVVCFDVLVFDLEVFVVFFFDDVLRVDDPVALLVDFVPVLFVVRDFGVVCVDADTGTHSPIVTRTTSISL